MTTLKETLRAEMTVAMKNRQNDPVRLMTLRALVAAISKAETTGARRELSDAEVQDVLRKEAKVRRETAETYRSLSVTDRADQENAEALVIEEFLPRELTEDEIRAVIVEIIALDNITGVRSIGLVMSQLRDRSDISKGIASNIAKELLA